MFQLHNPLSPISTQERISMIKISMYTHRILPPPPFCSGGAKNFEALLKRVGLVLFKFFLGWGGQPEPQGGDGIFQGVPEDFQQESLNR